MKQKDYWSGRILDWEDASFGDSNAIKHLSILERLANLVRHTVRHRRELALLFIEQQRPNSMLELGCGSGALSLNLAAQNLVPKIDAVDIALPAIESAKQKAVSMGLQDRVTFTCASLNEMDLSDYEDTSMVVALGLTPYLTRQEFENLIRYCGNREFIMDFHLKGWNLQNTLHAVYRAIKGLPFYIRYDRKTLPALLAELGVKNPVLEYSEGVCYVRQPSS